MGGRGSAFRRGGTSGGNIDIIKTTSLISQREGKQDEVDKTLTVLRDALDRYGVDLNDAQVATLGGSGASVLAYYDAQGNLAINTTYFDTAALQAAYERCVASGFHPSNGSKSGMEAVVAHEVGHALTDAAGARLGYGAWQVDRVASEIMNTVSRQLGVSMTEMQSSISGYAKQNHAEAVAEAYADVYCNGTRANRVSQAVVTELERLLRR